MWFFRSPQIIFGEDALSWLSQIGCRRIFIVTDETMQTLGHLKRVTDQLEKAAIPYAYFAAVEPEPSIETVNHCARMMTDFCPDWVIGLGGGSCMDAAKAAWFSYERPDVSLNVVNAAETYGLRARARLITIPTTAGSGAEVTAAAILTDTGEMRKLEVNSYELVADYAIIDPSFSVELPRQITADTGIDALVHAIEGFSGTWANDFSDGLCLQATRMLFEYLPLAVANGATDPLAREKMANAATIAALGMSNSHISLAHSFGHATGVLFRLPHGRITGLFLPYTIEYAANGGSGRYRDVARLLGLCTDGEVQAGHGLAEAIRNLYSRLGSPVNLQEVGVTRQALDANLESLCDRVEVDISLFTSRRMPLREEIKRLFEYAYIGKVVDF